MARSGWRAFHGRSQYTHPTRREPTTTGKTPKHDDPNDCAKRSSCAVKSRSTGTQTLWRRSMATATGPSRGLSSKVNFSSQ